VVRTPFTPVRAYHRGLRTDALYAAVYAHPADDAPRSVLADHLQAARLRPLRNAVDRQRRL
jgi:hypothetical protein